MRTLRWKTEKQGVVHLNDIEGQFVISDEVVASIAGSVLEEIDGLRPLTVSSLSRFGRKGPSKAVKVRQEEGSRVFIEAKVAARYGISLQDLGHEACRTISNAVEEQTGLSVSEVTIRIEAVDFDE